jgi:hypothetical protein
LFIILLGGAIFFAVLIVYYLIRAFYHYEYVYLPFPKEIEKDLLNIEKYYSDKYYQKLSKINKKDLIDKDENELLNTYFKDCITENIRRNDKKAAYLHKSSTTLIILLILLMLSASIFFIKFNSIENIQNVKITNFNELKK